MWARMGRACLAGCLAVSSVSLSGCASFRSEPQAIVTDGSDLNAVKTTFARTTVLEAYRNLSTEEARVAYRNQVAYVWIAASDARYDQFIQRIAQEVRGSNFGSNLLVLLLNGAAVVSGNEARRAMASASATVVGGASAFNRDILQNQTAAAIINAAEARRLRELTEIRRKLLSSSAADYPLGDALGEIDRLNRAANLNRASSELTASSAADLAAAEKEARQVVSLSVVSADVHAVRVAFAKYVRGETDAAKLEKLRVFLNAASNSDPVELRQNIIDAYARRAEGGKAAIDEMTSPLKDITGQEFKS